MNHPLSRLCRPLLMAAVCLSCLAPALLPAAEDDQPPVLAVFSFSGSVTEAPAADDFPFATSTESFRSLLNRLSKVEKDETAKGVVLMVSSLSLGRSQIEEVRAGAAENQSGGQARGGPY